MAATVLVAPAFGILAAIQTAMLSCRHHTIDACIPLFEALFGVLVAVAVALWLATSSRRGRSTQSGLVLAVADGIVFAGILRIVGPLLCPDPGRDDVVCRLGLPLGVVAFLAVALGAWRLQRVLVDRPKGRV